ncbi:hypothetical protein OUZ56_014898 [Daphnia magna]|uniref:Uncharacterized protein n=1 Tax=Daphnia magna TaxID=35525 RepID=A0ABR0AL89_9CRUS|nr:hypothetical protein OUZ56_014898 [Daphnia magna]
MSFIWKWIGSWAMESEVMTVPVRDAQERAVGSSVRECRCTYGCRVMYQERGPGLQGSNRKEKKKKKKKKSAEAGSDLATVDMGEQSKNKNKKNQAKMASAWGRIESLLHPHPFMCACVL